jgi:uncharacterized protein YuzE
LEKNKIVFSYDKEADVAYLSFGNPRPSVTEELNDYVLVRRDPTTCEITGLTITNFNRYFGSKKELKIEVSER